MTASRTESRGSNTPHNGRRWHGLSGRPAAAGARGRFLAPARGARQGFWRGTRGAAAVETVVSMFILVSAFATLMNFVTSFYVEDELGRAARAAARSLAINPGVDPWEAAWKEIDPSKVDTDKVPATHCTTDWTATPHLGTCGGLTLVVRRGVSPAALAAALDPDTPAPTGDAEEGELVLVGLSSQSSGSVPGVSDANANPPPDPTAEDLVKMEGVGVARREPAA